ncbi:MFS transporter, partial [Chloroflexota bacterium]
YFLRSTPEEMGLLPDGDKKSEVTETSAGARSGNLERQSPATDYSSGEINFTVRETLKTKTFWVYIAGLLFRMSVITTINIHLIPHLVDMGIEYQAASSILGYTVLLSLVGRLGFGFLGDFFDKRIGIFISCMLQAIGIWIFINASSIGMLYWYVVIYGVGYGGAFPLLHALRADLFGRKTFATIMGITGVISMLPTVAAPVLIGYLYDVTQSYTTGFYTLMAMSLVAGFLFLLVRKPKLPVRMTHALGNNQ